MNTKSKSEYAKEWYRKKKQNDPEWTERFKEYQKDYALTHKKTLTPEQKARYQQKNNDNRRHRYWTDEEYREKCKALSRQYSKTHKKENTERHRRYVESNREQCREVQKQYYHRNKIMILITKRIKYLIDKKNQLCKII